MQSPAPASSRPPLAEFVRGHQPAPDETFSRAIAAGLTAGLYALLVFMARPALQTPTRPPPSEIVAQLLPDVPRKTVAPPPKPFLARLLKPPVQDMAPPTFTIAPDAAPAPAQLMASAAPSSPLAGGTPAGAGDGNPATSADGSNGNSSGQAGCYDAAWAQRVTNRVGRFFYYPAREFRNHVTGVVLVHLVIRRYGRVELVKVDRTSGDQGLDLAATTMVRNAQPLPWIPEHMHADRIEAQLPIEFGTIDPSLKATIGDCGT
jgi:TonB family protein